MSYDWRFKCTKCDYSQRRPLIPTPHYLATKPCRFVHVAHQLGWCHDESCFVRVEVLPTEERLRQTVEHDYVADHVRKHGEYEEADEAIVRWTRRSAINDEAVRLELLAGRRSPPRCLNCASTRVIPLGDEPGCEEPQASVPIGLRHPGCDGDMVLARDDTPYFSPSISYAPEALDIEGRPVKAEPIPGLRWKLLHMWPFDPVHPVFDFATTFHEL